MYHKRQPLIYPVLTWNAVDALTTQTALLAYEYVLSYVMGSEFHGIFGYAISILYIAEAVINFGFDSNLAAYSEDILDNWKNMLAFVCGAWIPQIALITVAAIYLHEYAIDQILGSTFAPAYRAWIAIFLIEGIRKTCKHIVRYMGHVRLAAITEIVGTLAYVGIASTALIYNVISSLRALLYLHAVSASFQTACLMLCITQYAQGSSHPQQSRTYTFSLLRFHVHRIFVGINEFAGTLYTGNFLIPFVTYSRGYDFASVFRLVWNTARWFVLGIQQIFAATGSIVLAQQKQQSIEQRSQTFYKLTHYLHQIVYAGIFFVIINSHWLFVPQETMAITNVKAISIGFFLFALTIVDSFCAFYLRWYIVEEQAYSIAIFNIISILGMDAIVRFQDLGDIITIVAMFAVRTLAFIMISAWSFYVWNLRPSLKWGKESISITLVISILWLVIHVWQYGT